MSLNIMALNSKKRTKTREMKNKGTKNHLKIREKRKR